MKTIYIDSENKCHTTNDGTMIEVQTEFFNGKCDEFIEGHCYEVHDGVTSVYPWKDSAKLENVQIEHERQLIAEYESALAEIEMALGV